MKRTPFQHCSRKLINVMRSGLTNLNKKKEGDYHQSSAPFLD